MVSHDNQIASYAQRMLFLSDGKFQKMEKKGLAYKENEMTCPNCGGTLARDAMFCSHCGQKIAVTV